MIVRCKFCDEWRDTSSKYTSPANAKRDFEWWRDEHESGKCADQVSSTVPKVC